MSLPLVLRVLRVSDAGALVPGTSFAIHERSVTIGRSPDADVVLADPSVSRQHLRIVPGPPILVEALTHTNGTFFAGQRLDPEVVKEIPPEGGEIQLGGVLLALEPLRETEPVFVSLEPEARAEAAVFEVVWDGGHCLVRCHGVDLGLTGTAARFFGLLADEAGDVVHHWDLQGELGTPHLAPLATAVRRALADAVDHGVLDLEWLRGRAGEPTGDVAEVLRRLVQSRRAHGYALHLLPHDLSVTRV